MTHMQQFLLAANSETTGVEAPDLLRNAFRSYPDAWTTNPKRLTATYDEILANIAKYGHNGTLMLFVEESVRAAAESHEFPKSDLANILQKISTSLNVIASSETNLNYFGHIPWQRLYVNIVATAISQWGANRESEQNETYIDIINAANPISIFQFSTAHISFAEHILDYFSSPEYPHYEDELVIGKLLAVDTNTDRLADLVGRCPMDYLGGVIINPAATPEVKDLACSRLISQGATISEHSLFVQLRDFWSHGDHGLIAKIAARQDLLKKIPEMGTTNSAWDMWMVPLEREENAPAFRALMAAIQPLPATGAPSISRTAFVNPAITDQEVIEILDVYGEARKSLDKWEMRPESWANTLVSAAKKMDRGEDALVALAIAIPPYQDVQPAFKALITLPAFSVEGLQKIATARRGAFQKIVLAELERRNGASAAEAVVPKVRNRVVATSPEFATLQDALKWVARQSGFESTAVLESLQSALTNMATPPAVRNNIGHVIAEYLNDEPERVAMISAATWKLLFRFKNAVDLSSETLTAMLSCGVEEAEQYAGKKILQSLQ